MHPRAQRDINIEVAARAGVVRVAELVDLGSRRADFERAVRDGSLVRVRPGWVALPGADPLLLSAAKRGVVLSCLTQTRSLGLWVREQRPGIHVAASPGSAGGRPDSIRVHCARPVIPRQPGVLEDPIENVLAIVAECEPYERALVTWESALNQQLVERDAG